MKKLNKKGFTLVELIVVIAIIGILAAVLVPSVTSYIGKAQKSSAQQNAANSYQEFVLAAVDQCQTDVANWKQKDKAGTTYSLDGATDTTKFNGFYYVSGDYVCVIVDGSVVECEKTAVSDIKKSSDEAVTIKTASKKLNVGEIYLPLPKLSKDATTGENTLACDINKN